MGDTSAATFKAGDSFSIPRGVPHGGKSGPQGAKVLRTFVVDKTKPTAAPAP